MTLCNLRRMGRCGENRGVHTLECLGEVIRSNVVDHDGFEVRLVIERAAKGVEPSTTGSPTRRLSVMQNVRGLSEQLPIPLIVQSGGENSQQGVIIL